MSFGGGWRPALHDSPLYEGSAGEYERHVRKTYVVDDEGRACWDIVSAIGGVYQCVVVRG